MAEPKARRRRRFPWRPWLRAIHRDVGYLAVGLTFVYALSGLAVNHIADWDPNFTQIEQTYELALPLPDDDRAIAERAVETAGIDAAPVDVYRASDDQLDVVLDERTLHVSTTTGHVVEEGQKARFFLRAANFLHLNRGKQAWTIIADGYAVFLLFLATSGLFMLPGRKGLLGRGIIFVVLGAAVPIAYVTLSGVP